MNQEGGIDVYNFLHMVRGSANGEESNTDCLGVDVDDLVLEDEYAEWEPSPEHNSSFDKPSFEDSAEFENCLDNLPGESTWEKVSAFNSGSSGGWDVDKNAGTTTGKGDVWSGWGRDKAENQDAPSLKPPEDSAGSGGWDSVPAWGTGDKKTTNDWGRDKAGKQDVPSLKPQEDSAGSGGWDAVPAWGTSDKKTANDWGRDKAVKQDAPSLKPQEDSAGSGGWDAVPAWGTGNKKTTNDWGRDKAVKQDVPSLKPQEDSAGSGGWDSVPAWGPSEKKTAGDSVSSDWGALKSEQRDIISTKAQEDSFRSDGWDVAASWEKGTAAKSESSGWGTKKAEAGVVISEKDDSFRSDVSVPWEKKTAEKSESSLWGTKKAEASDVISSENVSSGWGMGGNKSRDSFVSAKVQENSPRARSWDAATPWGKKAGAGDESQPCRNDGKPLRDRSTEPFDWDKKRTQERVQSTSSGDWTRDEHPSQSVDVESPANKKLTQETVQSTPGWASSTAEDSSRDEHSSLTVDVDSPANSNPWGQVKSPESSQGWGSQNESKHGWGSPNAGSGNESDRHNNQWGRGSMEFKKNRFEGSKGWGTNNGEWKSKNRPAKSPGPGRTHDDAGAGGIFTATRQRLDMFTSEEQDVLVEIEQIMQDIRKIMHRTGYVFHGLYLYSSKQCVLVVVFVAKQLDNMG